MPDPRSYDELLVYQHPATIRKMITNTFIALWGRSKCETAPTKDGVAVLTEHCLTANIKHVIGFDAPYFGKMLYFLLAKGRDQVKITIVEWYHFLATFVD